MQSRIWDYVHVFLQTESHLFQTHTESAVAVLADSIGGLIFSNAPDQSNNSRAGRSLGPI